MIDYGFGVRLEALDSSDMETIRVWRNNFDIWKWCRQNDLISDTSQKRWFERQDNDSTIHMYMVTAPVGKVGVCGLTSHDRGNRIAEFSLYIAPEEQKQGFGEMALKTLVTHGFKNLNLHCVWGESFQGNPAIKMFKEVGFKSDGRRRDVYFKDGKYVDAEMFSLLEHEWKV